MKLQNLTVIFIIIIIPIILLVSLYISTGLKTIKLQTLYDTGLLTATHDAVYAFELNTTNDAYSNNAETKRNILKASIKAFEKSLCNSCNIPSYNTSEIEEYVPAIVFGLYDGFYMYAPSEIWNSDKNKYDYKHNLKNYVYYSEVLEDETVITYSLDNYIVVSGDFGNGYETRSGYLIDLAGSSSNGQTYKGIQIASETIEYIDKYDYYGNTIKSYAENEAINYYKKAYEFTTWFNNNIGNSKEYLNINSSNDPEDENSKFSMHKKEIIKDTIENVLNSSITAYSKRMRNYNYKMPKLSEEDWQKIYNNISMITFFQGKNIGLTKYNGYCVLNSTNNNEYVNPNLMYFVDENDETYHDIRCKECSQNITGYKIGNFIKKKISIRRNINLGDTIEAGEKADENGDILNSLGENQEKSIYVYNRKELACYNCINGTLEANNSIYNYIRNDATDSQKTAYFTALGRERNRKTR